MDTVFKSDPKNLQICKCQIYDRILNQDFFFPKSVDKLWNIVRNYFGIVLATFRLEFLRTIIKLKFILFPKIVTKC